jgi:hypothetical protein
VSVPYFLLFLCFRKATQDIFSELDETKANILVFSENKYIPKKAEKNIFLQFSFLFDFSLVMNINFIVPPIENKCP